MWFLVYSNPILESFYYDYKVIHSQFKNHSDPILVHYSAIDSMIILIQF